MPLRTADLFAGMGGWTIALKGAAEPVLYCDCDPRCAAFLRSEMEAGRLPEAPIVPDVRDVAALRALAPVDLVTAGFPCVGFSSAGLQKGLSDGGSCLFHDAVRAAQALEAKAIAFENVADVLRFPDFRVMLSTLVAAGFADVRWTVVSASDVGAPHRRRRWFCLARCPSTPIRLTGWLPLAAWGSPPQAVSREGLELEDHDMLALIGNSLVPQAARGAVLHLLCADVHAECDPKRPIQEHGAFVDGVMYALTPFHSRPVPVSIVLDPTHYRTCADRIPAQKTLALPGPITRSRWPTPRHSSCSHSHVLTKRTSNDLGTAVRFASVIDGVAQERTDHRSRVSPAFALWLMRGDD